MKTRRIKGNDRENLEVLPEFVTLDGVTYLLCQYCGNPMDGNSNAYWWQEDKVGKPYNLHLVHYKCQQPFEETHEGKWFSKGMLSVKVDFAKKDIFLVWNERGKIVRVTTSYYIAAKYEPLHGSFREINPYRLALKFGNDPVVRTFLKTYKGGKLLPLLRNGE